MANTNNNAQQHPGQYTPEELYALAEQIAKMQAQHASQQQVQLVPVQPNLNNNSSLVVLESSQITSQNQQFPPYTGQQMVSMQGQVINGSAPMPQAVTSDANNSAMVPVMQQGSTVVSQPPCSGQPMPQAPPPNQTSIVTNQSMQMTPQDQTNLISLTSGQPSQEVVLASVSPQLTNPSVNSNNPNPPDNDETLRLRGGGDDNIANNNHHQDDNDNRG
eukprot:scaffold157880_cov23-Cyclotella_meneghiniana.AAC.1